MIYCYKPCGHGLPRISLHSIDQLAIHLVLLVPDSAYKGEFFKQWYRNNGKAAFLQLQYLRRRDA